MNKVLAGLSYATELPDMDYETYSEAGAIWNGEKWVAPQGAAKRGLSAVGMEVYARHASTEVLTMSYDLKDGKGKRRWRPSFALPFDLFDYLSRGGLIEAHNSAFEERIWRFVCMRKYGFPPLNPDQLRCSMAKARAHSLPGALGNLTNVLQTKIRKDADGERLLKKFSEPRNPTKKDARLRIRPEEEPEDGERLYSYCDTDIASEAEASLRIPDLEGEELEYWLLDQRINRRGVHVDREGIHNAIEIINQTHAAYGKELAAMTGGIKPSEVSQLKKWVEDTAGIWMNSFDEEQIDATLKRLHTMLDKCRAGMDALDDPDLTGSVYRDAIRALEIRQAVGSASVKKVFSMANQVTEDSRLHNLFNYHGARTGRPTGEGPQPTNLPKSGPPLIKCGLCGKHHAVSHSACPWCGVPVPPGRKPVEWGHEAAAEVLEVMKARSYSMLEYYYGSAMQAVSGCLRGLYTAAPGHELICSDFSAIEGVVTAQLAGEEWRLDVFRTHGKIYEMSASKTTGTPFEEMMRHKGYTDITSPEWWKVKTTGSHHPDRNRIGKFQELALGFGGWINAMINFGANEFLTEEEMRAAITAWRAASPSIPELWGGQYRGLPWERGGATAELFGLEGAFVKAVLNPGQWQQYRELAYIKWGDAVYCRLPSGRCLTYHRPRLTPGEWFDLPILKITYEGWNTNPKMGAPGWVTINTYGGRLTENVVQATARDIQRNAQLLLEKAGYPVVLHVYDENVCEVPIGYGSIEEFEKIMATMPPWAHNWPIRAGGGWRGLRYRKD